MQVNLGMGKAVLFPLVIVSNEYSYQVRQDCFLMWGRRQCIPAVERFNFLALCLVHFGSLFSLIKSEQQMF